MKFLVLALCIVAATADYQMLTADEAKLVKSTWNEVKTRETDILYAVFKAYPEIQSRFPKFAGKELDSIKGTADFAVHASRIVSFFTQYVNLLGYEDTQPAIKTILNELGYNHKYRGVTKEYFNHFRTAFMSYLKGHVNYTPEVEHAWGDAFDKMFFVIFSALEGHPVN